MAQTTSPDPEQDPMATTALPDGGAGFVPIEELATGPRFTRSSLHASGGMGNVWLARDCSIGRDVALKELRAEGGSAPRRFVREARITGQLEHPGVVPVYELGRDPETGRPFYAMRFVRGRTLTEVAGAFHRDRRPDGYEPMELVGLLTAFVSVCNTIAYAHSHGVIHRDLKGENVILGEFGEVIVLDWGLAKRLDEADEDAATGEPEPPAEPVAGQNDDGTGGGDAGVHGPGAGRGAAGPRSGRTPTSSGWARSCTRS